MELSAKLENLRLGRGWSQRQLAARAGVSPSTAGRWLHGDRVPNLFEAARLACVLGVPLDYLADDGADAPPAPPAEVEGRILWLARSMGYDEAVRRLAAAPGGAAADRPAGEMTPERRLPNPGPDDPDDPTGKRRRVKRRR